ncbi:aminoglycoside phosphotransferase family protein [Kribbella sp. NPDC058693]|uniref:aminoglycoside phosphotransferase family protein n=1 Tax=Kribbella sp. NPDC058693 TaxID=3346602 RepID=UPI003655AE1D
MTHTISVSGSTLTKHYTSWSRNEPDREWAALTLLSAAAPELVPHPLARTPAPSLTMTVVPGQPLTTPLTSAQITALGDALEALWSFPPDTLRQIDLPALVDRTRTGLTALQDADGVIALAARAWLENEPPDLSAVQEPVVAHGDPNLTNYLWDGTRIRIIDFEDAGLGDRTVELANLVEHLSGRETDWTPLVRRFGPAAERFRAARCLWAGFWLTLIGPGGPSAHRNPPGTAEAQAERVLRLVAG